jgi:hypothetical protein
LHTKILLGNFNGKLGREDHFNLTIGKEILYEDSNDNVVPVCSYKKTFTNKPGTLLLRKHKQTDRASLERVQSNCDLSGTCILY